MPEEAALAEAKGSPLWRLFVACPLPPRVLEAIAQAQQHLRSFRAPPLRIVRPENVHLTLKFLSDVPPDRAPAIGGAVSEAAAELPGFNLALDGVGAFGNRRTGPRVVWVGLEGDLPRLISLQERVERSLAALGFPPEGRPFSPHLTLARIGQPLAPAPRQELEALLASIRPDPVPFAVSRVVLFRSILGAGGASYQELHAVSLASKKPSGDSELAEEDRPRHPEQSEWSAGDSSPPPAAQNDRL